MHKQVKSVFYILVLAIFCSCNQDIIPDLEINKVFSEIDTLEIETVSGDCIFSRSSSDSIYVKVLYEPEATNSFKPEFVIDERKLHIKERVQGQSIGKTSWLIMVPENVEIDAGSVSGKIVAEGLHSGFSAETVSGGILVSNSTGHFNLGSVSGKIKGLNLSGEFNINTISGRINFNATKVLQPSSWGSVSGDLVVQLAEEVQNDIILSSISGNVLLHLNGINQSGFFEFIAEKDKGCIISPISFVKETTFNEEGKLFEKKSFIQQNAAPKILLNTISGEVELITE